MLWSIAKEHGGELIELCRRTLRRPEAQKGCFEHFTQDERWSCLRLAIDVLGRNGNSVDAALLREFAPDPVLGRNAIAALKELEDRVQKRRIERALRSRSFYPPHVVSR